MILVVDASVAVKWFVRETHQANALDILRGEYQLHAPDWIASEVSHALYRKWRAGEVSAEHVRLAVNALPRYFDHLHRSAALVARAVDLALELLHPVYDCLYLACAEAANGAVITADTELVRSVREPPYAQHVHHIENPAFRRP